jgi:hypothetical protein
MSKTIKKSVGIILLIALVIGSVYLYGKALFTEKVIHYETEQIVTEVVVDSYEKRVEDVISSTTKEWQEKHRNWAEQEVTKQIMEENESRLRELRQEELSF